MNKIYRIKDIAELSGVSVGTVDRILHKRGKVSEEARRKVEKVMGEIEYHPNLVARSLAMKRRYRFCTLLPTYAPGEYWEQFCTGLEKAERELFSYNVENERLYFDQYDRESFDRLAERVAEEEWQGVVIATLFHDSVAELARRLDQRSIPYVLVDAYVEQTNCLAYYGSHSYDSGFLAGHLMLRQLAPGEDIALFRFIRKGEPISNQARQREAGFRECLTQAGFAGHIYATRIAADDPEHNRPLLDAFFAEHPTLGGGVLFNSRAYLLGDYLTRYRAGCPFKLIGYDVVVANVRYLEAGIITHLIAQRPGVQGVHSLRTLFRYHARNEKPADPVNYMPIDVLIKENIRYYNNYI